MSKRDQLNQTDSTTGKVLPEGYYTLLTSAGNAIGFHGPAERESYRSNPANATQLGPNRGSGDTRGR
jgi:hypothetical protein